MINIGIDLGTTNSAIAKFDRGRVVVFKNPIGHKETLPSVVAFRKQRIIVGDKAREYLLKDPKNVVGSFKRKMGTTEYYYIKSIGERKTPIDLSAQVLKELKNFVHTGEELDAAVITIPAAFDTVQSNATRKAGHQAGFSQVVLLQEPIAASLAYANKDETDSFEEGQWIVYDLGGGTFDVALVNISDGEMKVIDHEGDNFLGGTDFDKAIVEKVIIPYLEKEGVFNNLEQDLKSASGKYNKLYYKLLHLAEEAKVQLSTSEVAEIEFEIEDDVDAEIEAYILLDRVTFEDILAPYIDQTVEMIRSIMERNSLSKNDVKFVLMVGGSTYIPYVRRSITEKLNIPTNCNVDPTTAVAEGAAFYAGTKPKKKPTSLQTIEPNEVGFRVHVKMAYQKATQDDEEYFTARISGDITGLYYRITRQDGGFDTGLKPLTERISEDLSLVKDAYNYFDFRVYDEQNNEIATNADVIGIAQGRYSVVGQPLPNDICLEIDDLDGGTTILELVFSKNDILPLKKTIVKEITRTIRKGSDSRITINIVEGPNDALPIASQTIGFISVSGKQLTRDLVKGSDVEITLELSESRDLRIMAYLMMTDQEFEDVFTPSDRQVNIYRLNDDLTLLASKLKKEVEDAVMMENYETAQRLAEIQDVLNDLIKQASKLSPDDVTDEKFQIEDRKRKIAQQVDQLTRDKRIIKLKMEYFRAKKYVKWVVEQYDIREEEQKQFDELMAKEKSTLMSNSKIKIEELTDKLWSLASKIRWRSPQYVKWLFYDIVARREELTNKEEADKHIEVGEKAIEEEKYDQLRICVNRLYSLLPPAIREQIQGGGTGIG